MRARRMAERCTPLFSLDSPNTLADPAVSPAQYDGGHFPATAPNAAVPSPQNSLVLTSDLPPKPRGRSALRTRADLSGSMMRQSRDKGRDEYRHSSESSSWAR